MAARGWANSTVTAMGAAAIAGAAQLGLGYGLGIIVWQPTGGPAGEALWLASLTWVVWAAASSTALGAIWTARRPAGRTPLGTPAGARTQLGTPAGSRAQPAA